MKLRGYLSDLDFRSIGRKGYKIIFETLEDIELEQLNNYFNKDLEIEFKEHKEKRSNNANSYMWKLCDEVAKKINSTKEEVYRKAIRDVGVFTIVPIIEKAVDRYMDAWRSNGVGWVAEVLDDSKFEGYKKIICYYGSSKYNTKEMARLIDWIVEEAKEVGVETLPPNELKSMKESWGI